MVILISQNRALADYGPASAISTVSGGTRAIDKLYYLMIEGHE